MNHILDDPNSPTQQPSAPRAHWSKEVKAFQCREFAMTVRYDLCEDHSDGLLHIKIIICRITWFDDDKGQPDDEVLTEMAQDFLRDYYYPTKIIFE
jgi:hypothetical protein